jgi:hypothetical protein
MNSAQELWWKQAQSDHALFVKLRRSGEHECHLLHYLQMATEKLSKAYLWRSGHAPAKAHTGFVRFLKALLDRRADLDRIAKILGFGRREDLDKWVRNVQTLAYSLQNIAPAEAGNGPNPEYPWPHEAPADCPIGHRFDLWKQLTNTGQGRKLIEIIERALARFDQYA